MKRWMHNERGNITLLTLGLLGVMVLMFAVLFNLVKVYAIKQQAANAAQQASLAATSEIYAAVIKAVEEVDAAGLLGTGIPDPLKKSLAEQIEDKKTELYAQHRDWSDREVYLEAMDQVLVGRLQDPMYLSLKTRIEDGLRNALPQIQQAVENTIVSDGGQLGGTTMEVNA